jgi:hypothetical protein
LVDQEKEGLRSSPESEEARGLSHEDDDEEMCCHRVSSPVCYHEVGTGSGELTDSALRRQVLNACLADG